MSSSSCRGIREAHAFRSMGGKQDLQPSCLQKGHTQGREEHDIACLVISHLLVPDPGVQHVIGCKHQAGNLQEQTGRSVLDGCMPRRICPSLRHASISTANTGHRLAVYQCSLQCACEVRREASPASESQSGRRTACACAASTADHTAAQ